MQDLDKWPPIIQWLVGIGVLAGATFAGWMGSRRSRRPDDDDRDHTDREERARLLVQINNNELEAAFGKTIEATRQSFRDEIADLAKRVRKNEDDILLLKNK